MRFKNDEKIFSLKEFAKLLSEGENINGLDILSVFNQSISSLIQFVNTHYNEFSENEISILLPFLDKNISLTNRRKESTLDRDNLSLTYKEMDLETGEIKIQTTKEDAQYVFDELTKNNIKINTEIMYLALKRYAKGEYDTLFPFKQYIEDMIYEKREIKICSS